MCKDDHFKCIGSELVSTSLTPPEGRASHLASTRELHIFNLLLPAPLAGSRVPSFGWVWLCQPGWGTGSLLTGLIPSALPGHSSWDGRSFLPVLGWEPTCSLALGLLTVTRQGAGPGCTASSCTPLRILSVLRGSKESQGPPFCLHCHSHYSLRLFPKCQWGTILGSLILGL